MTDVSVFPPGGPEGPDIGTTTTTRPRNRPGTTTSTPSAPPTTMLPSTTLGTGVVPTSTVPATSAPAATVATTPIPTTVPLAQPEPMDMEAAVRGAYSFEEGLRNTTLSGDVTDSRFLYPSRPLGFRGAVRQTTIETETDVMVGDVKKREIRSETQYYLDPALIQNPILDRINRDIENIRSNINPEYRSTPVGRLAIEDVGRRSRDYINVERGDQYATEADVAQFLNRMTTNEMLSFKNDLIRLNLLDADDAGYLPDKDINDATWEAAIRLGEAANQNGMEYTAFRRQVLQSGYKFDKATTKTGPKIPPIRLTSKADIATTANQVALQRIGRELAQPEIDAFVSSYNQMERDFQRQYYANPTEIVEQPSVQGATQEMLATDFEDEAQMYATGDVLDSFRRILGGGT